MDQELAKYLRYMPIYESAFDCLAKMEIPDLKEFNRERVFEAFCFLASNDPQTVRIQSQENLDWMCQQVHDKSRNKVEMKRTAFDTGIKGPNAQFILTNGNLEKKLVFSPSAEPFEFYS